MIRNRIVHQLVADLAVGSYQQLGFSTRPDRHGHPHNISSHPLYPGDGTQRDLARIESETEILREIDVKP